MDISINTSNPKIMEKMKVFIPEYVKENPLSMNADLGSFVKGKKRNSKTSIHSNSPTNLLCSRFSSTTPKR